MKHLFHGLETKALETQFIYFRQGGPENAELNEGPEAGLDGTDPVDEARDAEAFRRNAEGNGDAAVNHALTRAQGITAEHAGTYKGRTEFRNVNGFEVAVNNGAQEKRAIAEAMRQSQLEDEAADRELQDAMADTEAMTDDPALSGQLDQIDAGAEAQEAEVTGETQAELRDLAAAGNEWAADAGIEDDAALVQS